MKGNVEFKTFDFKVNAADQEGMIRGYASTFGNIDLGFDVVDKGAFKKTIKESKGVWPILADHDPASHIGWNLRAEEDDKGLAVEFQLDLNTQKGREKYSLAKKAQEIGGRMGLSIGYATIKAEPDRENPRVRRLKELKLYEHSVVTFPMNTLAYVTAMKSGTGLQDEQRVEEILLALKQWKKLGYTQHDFQKALQSCFGAVTKENPDPEKSSHAVDELDKLIKIFKG